MKIIRLDEKSVKAALDAAPDQGEAILAVYRMVFPEWDRIAELQGHPKCNEATSKALFRLFMAWDEKHFPVGPHGLREVLPGGGWMNYGFSTREAEHLQDWQVERCAFTLQEQANAA